MDSDDYITCPTCQTNFPPANEALHQARCPGSQNQHDQQHQQQHVVATPATASSRPSREQHQHNHDDEDDEDDEEERKEATTIDLTGSSPVNVGRPTLPSNHAPAAAAATATAGNMGLGSRWDNETEYDSDDDNSSGMASPRETVGRPKDDRVGGGGGGLKRGDDQEEEEDNEYDDDDGIQIQCPICTFFNSPGMDVCQMCMHPLANGLVGRVGQHQLQHQAGGGGDSGMEEQEDDAAARWTCPLCTYCDNRRGNWVCQACEVGRPRREDMMDATNGDGYVMVSPYAGRGGRGGGRRRGGGGGGGGGAQAMLEAMMTGALFGGGVAGVASAVGGGTRGETQRRILMGSLVGGIGGGLLGGQLQQMMMAQQQEDAVDSMSYEDLLNLFGPGNEPQKASAESVNALPEGTLSASEVERMRRESTGDARDCSVCMEEFAEGDSTRRLPCLHRFHKACIDKWLLQCNASCPICKVPIAEA